MVAFDQKVISPTSPVSWSVPTRAPANPTQKPIPKSLINSDAASRAAGDTIRNHDFVSDGFLALIVAGLLLLCSSLLAYRTSLAGPGAVSPLLVRDEPTVALPSPA